MVSLCKMVRIFKYSSFPIAAILIWFAGLGALTWVGLTLLDRSADHLIKQDAERRSIAWALHVGEELGRIADVEKKQQLE